MSNFNQSGLSSPAGQAEAVTPSDSTDLTTPSRALYVGGSGDVRVLLIGDVDPVTFVGCVASQILPIRVKRVYLTLTTATYIVAIR